MTEWNRINLTENERRAFNKWFTEKYGLWKVFSSSLTDKGLQPYILEWIRGGKPWLEEIEAGVTPLPRGVIPPKPESVEDALAKRLGGIEEDIRAKMNMGESILVSEFKEVDLPPLEGFEWEKVTVDPNTGLRIDAPFWVTKKIEEESEEDTDIYGMTELERLMLLLEQQEAGQRWARGSAADILAQQQFGLQREEFEWQKQQAQQKIAQSYEDWRRRLLGELTGPEDWITRWQVEQTPEKYPWEPAPRTEFPEIDLLETAIAQKISSAGGRPEDLDELEHLISMERQLEGWKQEEIESQKIAAAWPEQPTIGQIAAGAKTKAPPAPAWFPEYAPGQVAGRAITKESIPTPSGQQLTRLPPSQAAGLGGYVEWAGGRPWQDILAHAEIMQPEMPRGAGQTRWRPVTQRA
tara:strand:+ start:6835 stop:8061 length:1227 start_codon:yes stop_codon:yes gene_type:complete